MELAKTKGLRA